MKIYQPVIVLMLLSPCSAHGAMYYTKPAPRLHSIFDIDSPVLQSPQLSPAGSSRSITEQESKAYDLDFRKERRALKAEKYRRTGVVLYIAGGPFLLGGVGTFIYAGEVQREETANGGRDHTLIYWIIGGLLCVVWFVFTAIGLPLWLTHLHH